MKNFLSVVLLLSCAFGVAYTQNFTRTYAGWWASTQWTFNFLEDGSFTRKTTGHYGNTEIKGTYTITSDTLKILTGYEDTHGTINPAYLLDGEDFIVDLESGYDYKNIADGTRLYNSKERFVKYPQAKPGTGAEKQVLADVISLLVQHPNITPYFHFKENPNRKLLFASYYFINEKNPLPIDMEGKIPVFKDVITTDFYIEITTLKIYDISIRMEIFIHGEGVNASAWFYKKNGSWVVESLDVNEK